MPELPEVQTVVNGLNELWVGMNIVSIVNSDPGKLEHFPGTLSLPARVRSVERRGKFIIVRLNEGGFVTHLRMTGKFAFAEPPVPRHIRCVFTHDDGSTLYFIDPRRFATFEVFTGDQLPLNVTALGVDPLALEFTPEYLAKALQRKAPVKSLLLNQTLIAGLGNIYVIESLYRAGISPLRPGQSVSMGEIRLLHQTIVAVLQEALAKNGTSVRDYRQVDEKSGEFQAFLTVYGKKTCPKGHDLVRIVIAGRGTVYCPQCQK